jgi:hypothetical protein
MQKVDSVKCCGFWLDKEPCWVIRECIPEAREICIAYNDQTRPCWEQNTLCKELFDIDTCFGCEVYKRYCGKQEPDDA